MPIFLPGRPPAGCLMASTEACLSHVVPGVMAEQNQAVTRKVCPADDGKRVRGSVPRARELGGRFPSPFSETCSPRLGNPLHLPGRIIPGDFHPKCCYPAPTWKKRITIIQIIGLTRTGAARLGTALKADPRS
jgi:hypothetical protein